MRRIDLPVVIVTPGSLFVENAVNTNTAQTLVFKGYDSSNALVAPRIAPEDACNIQFTSGTTVTCL